MNNTALGAEKAVSGQTERTLIPQRKTGQDETTGKQSKKSSIKKDIGREAAI